MERQRQVRWHAGGKCWTAIIGYRWNRDRTRLVQAQFYWHGTQEEAVRLATEKAMDWKELKRNWADVWAFLQAAYPDYDGARPFWWQEEKREEAGQQQDEARAYVSGTITVGHAVAQYRAELQGRVGLKGNLGIKPTTAATHGYQVAGFLKAVPDPELPLMLVDRATVMAILRQIWCGTTSERTMLNYTREFSAFLAWCADNDALDWNMPKGVKKLLRHRSVNPPIYVPTIAEVKAIAAAARPRFRAMLIFALNTGMTQKDIAAVDGMKATEFVTWKRAKTSHQNDFEVITWLWPETRANIRRYGLRTAAGTAFYREYPGGRRKDLLAMALRLCRRRAKVTEKFTFKSLRKFSADWLKENCGETTSRLYLGHRIPGVLGRYTRDTYSELTAGLQKLRGHLLENGVLAGEPSP